MRRLLLYIIILVSVIILLPMMLTKPFKEVSTDLEIENVNNAVEENAEISKYEYSNYANIKLLHKDSGDVQELNLDDYLLGVVSAEMPASFEMEALKAQAVVARTYTIYIIKNSPSKHENADICSDPNCCQAWISKEDRLERWSENEREENWKKIENAVYSTGGKIITYEGEPIDAFFHSNSGGKTEEVSNVWGGGNFPYLQSVETSGEEGYSQYASEISLSKNEFEQKIKEKYNDFAIDYNSSECIKILDYTSGGRVKIVKIGNKELSGVEVRKILGLKSANFIISIEGDNLRFEVKGYGHGVGMSQTGADSLAKQGKSFEEIIKHFYTGVEINNL